MAPRFPTVIPIQEVMFHPDVPSRSGGLTLTGDEEIVVSSAGRWRAKLTLYVASEISQRRADTILAYRAMLARNQGRANPFLIGPYDFGQSPAAVAGLLYGGDSAHDDDAEFDDGSPYTQAHTPAHAASAALRGAAWLDVAMEAGHTPEAGQYFGVGVRLYLISYVVPTDVADTYTLTFWPPLRADVPAETEVEFDDPVCLMRFADDKTGELALRGIYRGNPNIDLVEASQ